MSEIDLDSTPQITTARLDGSCIGYISRASPRVQATACEEWVRQVGNRILPRAPRID